MHFEGTLTSWNDERGFGYIESTQGGEPVFVHISAWPQGSKRPQLSQLVTFEIEIGPRGKRANHVRPLQQRRQPRRSPVAGNAPYGTTTLFVIPLFVVAYGVISLLWDPPIWIIGLYVVLSVITFAVYAKDKSAAMHGSWRTPENELHLLALAGGWPGALIAQQLLRHKSTKREFRQLFWITVGLNIAGVVALTSPLGTHFLQMQ